jgi:glycosyltransferase involved in cell wall biosynthesis
MKIEKICFFSTSPISQIMKEQYTKNDLKILRDLGFDVVVCNRLLDMPLDADLYFSWWASGSIYPTLLAKMVRRPNIVVAGGNEAMFYRDSLSRRPLGYLAAPLYKQLATRITLRLSTIVIVVSKFMEKDVVALGSRRCNILYNCVDNDKFSPNSDVTPQYITTSFRMDHDVIELKRGLNFISAAKVLLKNGFPLKFLIIGHKGSGFSLLRRRVLESGLKDSFTFTGAIENDDVVSYLRQTKCFLQLSDTETFGVAAAEAMSSGCPVVLSKSGALPEMAGNNAVYVDHNSPVDIARGVSDVLKMSESERIAFGLKCRERVVNNFSYERRKQGILGLIESAGRRYGFGQ